MALLQAQLGYPNFLWRFWVFRDYGAQLHEKVGEKHVSRSLSARETEWNGQKWFWRRIKGSNFFVDILVQVYPVSHFYSFDPREWKRDAYNWNALENGGWGCLEAVCPKITEWGWIFDFHVQPPIGRKTCLARIFLAIFVLDSPYLRSIPSPIWIACLVSEFWILVFFKHWAGELK